MIAEQIEIKWSKSEETIKFHGRFHSVLIRSSNCRRYHIITMPDGYYQFREVSPDGTFPIMSQRFDRLKDAKEFAIEQEKIRLIVWHYFVELGERNKTAADNWVENLTPTCLYMENVYRRDSKRDVTELIESSYAYHKYRAHLRKSSDSYAWSDYIDPAARRDWKERVDQTYIQYWNKSK